MMRPDLLLLYIPWFQFHAWEIPHPDAVTIGSWEVHLPKTMAVHPFGVLVAIGVLVGARVAELQGERSGLRSSAVAHAAAHVLLPAFVLAHLVDAVAYHPEVVAERPLFLLELWNGMSSYGGFLGAIVGGAYYVHRYRVPIRVIADPMAFSFPFGWLFGRIGCFGVHDHPGSVTMFFLGVADYEVGYPPFQVRHDLGLYEVLWCLAMIPLVLALGRKKRPRGFYLALVPLLYAPVRFGLDFLRATDIEGADERYFGLTPAHYGSVLLAAVALVALARALRDPDLAVPASVALAPPPIPAPQPEVPTAEAGASDRSLEPRADADAPESAAARPEAPATDRASAGDETAGETLP